MRLETILGGGLFNQHLELLAFATLGVASGASELNVLSSSRRYQAIDNFNWTYEPFETLWDKAELAAYLQGKEKCPPIR